jgi:4-hydroxy-3-polyprenylbenzoate decarboxylase
LIIIALTGASGIDYGIQLLKALKQLKIETGLLISNPAKKVIKYETNMSVEDIKALATKNYEVNDISSEINSGSCIFESLVIVPCSMKTLSSIANGYADNSITRVADVALKEHRKTIIVPRETPLRTVHIENMLKLSKEGAIILPAMPAFYNKPETLNDSVNFIVGKILDSLNIPNNLYTRWKPE